MVSKIYTSVDRCGMMTMALCWLKISLLTDLSLLMSRLATNYGRLTRPSMILGMVNGQPVLQLATNSTYTPLVGMFAPMNLQLENKYGRLTLETLPKQSMEHGQVST